MSKWARVNLENDSPVLEVITYDPNGVINEKLLSAFLACPDEVERGYWYNPETETFYLPEGYAKHPDFQTWGYIHAGNNEIDENGFIVFPPEPKYISEEDFRSQLSLTEKILWDNPETGTIQQTATINTAKKEFPLLTNSESTLEILETLELSEVIGQGKSTEIYNHFNQ